MRLIKKRLEILTNINLLSKREAEKFQEIEDLLNSPKTSKNPLDSYHITNDKYKPLLEKVLKGLIFIKEPYAEEKYNEYLAELGTMTPALYLTPWIITLQYLDQNIGNFKKIKKFYHFPV